jgi:hypothetical protein
VHSLQCSGRVGSNSRHPDDEFDRYWFPIQGSNSTFIQSTSPLQSLVASKIVGPNNRLWGEPPETVMDTALTSSGNITITFPDNYNYECILSFYYADLNSTANASSQNFYIDVPTGSRDIQEDPYSNGSNPVSPSSALVVVFNQVSCTPGTDIVLYPNETFSSPLGPIANALETWEVSTNPLATMTTTFTKPTPPTITSMQTSLFSHLHKSSYGAPPPILHLSK